MKRFSIKFISAVLSVLMLLSMVSCIFGLSASAEEMERDSGNMPLWFFDPDVMDTEKDDVRTFSDGSIRYTRTHKNDFGTALINDFVEFDFKSNSHWALTLRADSEISEGYVIGGNPSGIFIKKVDSTNALAYCEEGRYSMVSSGIWHRMRIEFEDTDRFTAVKVTLDGRKVPFIEGFKFTPNYGFQTIDEFDTNISVVNGILYDANPIQNANNTYVKVSAQHEALLVNPFGSVHFRSIDTDLSTKTETFRIVNTGDSITHGESDDTDGVWRVTLSKELNKLFGDDFDVYNAGVSGAQAYNSLNFKTYIYENQFTFSQRYDADLITIMLGTNDGGVLSSSVPDIATATEEDEDVQKFKAIFVKNYKKQIETYLDMGVQLVLFSPPYSTHPTGTLGVKMVVGWVEELAEEYDLPFFNTYEFAYGRNEWFSDDVHPNGEGKREIAKGLYNFLVNCEDITLTKTTNHIAPADYSEELARYEAPLTSYNGPMTSDLFYAYKYSSSTTDLRYIDGSVDANFGAISKNTFNLGTKWTAEFSTDLPASNENVYNGEHDWTKYRYSAVKVGPLRLNIYRPYNATDGYTYYAYRLFLFDKELTDHAVVNSYTAKTSYKIEYNNGSIKVIRTNDNIVLFDIGSSAVYEKIGNDFSFDGSSVSLTAFEYNRVASYTNLKLAAETTTPATYKVENTTHGHVEYGGGTFSNDDVHYVGEKINLTAVCDDHGYIFHKWVDANGNKISMDPNYTLTLGEGNNYIKAVFTKYTPFCEVSLTATAGGRVTINGTEYNANQEYVVGDTITLNAIANTGYTFLYWRDADGNILWEAPEFITTVTKIANYEAVFTANNSSTATILFVNRVNQVISTQSAAIGSQITLPELPNSYGYESIGWIIGESIYYPGDKYTVTKDAIIRTSFRKNATEYLVTVEGGTVFNRTSNRFVYNQKATVVFDDSLLGDGEVFYGWHIAESLDENSIISHAAEYTFYVGSNVTLTAVIKSGEIEIKPIIDVTNISVVNGGKTVSFLTERTVPSPYTLVESGVIYTANQSKIENLTLENVGGSVFARRTINTRPNGQLRMSLSSRDGSSITAYLVCYMTYIDDLGEYHTIYSNVYSGTTTSNSGSQDIIDEETDNFD